MTYSEYLGIECDRLLFSQSVDILNTCFANQTNDNDKNDDNEDDDNDDVDDAIDDNSGDDDKRDDDDKTSVLSTDDDSYYYDSYYSRDYDDDVLDNGVMTGLMGSAIGAYSSEKLVCSLGNIVPVSVSSIVTK